MRSLAARGASDRAFLSALRKDPRATLASNGYDLTEEEFAAVLDLRRRTAALGDGMVAALLAGGLKGGTGIPPARPRPPGGRGPARPGGRGPAKPGSPGRTDDPKGRRRPREG